MSDKRTIDTDIAMIVDLWSIFVISSDLELLNISDPSKLCLVFSLAEIWTSDAIRIQSELFHSLNESNWATIMSTKYLCFVQVPFWGELIKCNSVDKFPSIIVQIEHRSTQFLHFLVVSLNILRKYGDCSNCFLLVATSNFFELKMRSQRKIKKLQSCMT